MPDQELAADRPRRNVTKGYRLVWLILIGLAYEAVLVFVPVLRSYRLPVPYAVPIFDLPFVLVAIGVAYLCLERHRLRQDFGTAALGASLWLAALLALAHILTQPDYPFRPGVDAGVAPYFFFLSYLAPFVGIGLATHYGDRPLPLSDRSRPRVVIGLFALSFVIVLVVLAVQPVLPTLVMSPGRLTPFAIAAAAVINGVVGAWALAGGRKRLNSGEPDRVARLYVLAASIWLLGLIGFLTYPYRYAVSWYLAGVARPLGVLVVFISLLREQVWLYAELQANLQRLKETQAQLIQADKLTALGTLVSGVAHELNNPLTTIQLSTQLLQQHEGLPASARDRVDAISGECERASRIIRDLLIFARRRQAERERVDVNQLVEAALSLQARAFELANIRVVTELAPGLPAVWAASHHIEQVLLNVFSNAAHAMKSAHDGGVLTVRTLRRGGEARVEIADDGPGIPAEHLGRVFDPFFTTKPAGEGTGLGLSLSLGIVEQHGGRMTGTNVPGGGALFTITLPLREGAEPSQASVAEPVAPVRGARVLVVEDEGKLREALRDVLAALGHRVDEAATGREALAKLERETYDLITLDLRLPDMHGRDVYRTLQQSRDLASRVVFVTGDTMSAEAQKFLDEAGRPVLRKPLTIDGIRTTIAPVLGQSRPAEPSPRRGAATQ